MKGKNQTKWLKRTIKWLIVTLVALIVLIPLVFFVLLHNLDSPSVKSRLVSIVREESGIILDYRSFSMSLSGRITIEGLSVQNPEPLSRHAVELLWVDKLEVLFSPLSIFEGSPRVDSISISGIRGTLVVDEEIGSSLDLIIKKKPETEVPPPKTPTRYSSSLLLGSLNLYLGSIKVSDVALTQVRVRGEEVLRRDSITGLNLEADLDVSKGSVNANVMFGNLESPPIRIEIFEPPSGSRNIDLITRLAAAVSDSRSAKVELMASVPSHQISDALPPKFDAINLILSASFEPESGQTRLALERLEIMNGVIAGNVELILRDEDSHASPLEISRGSIHADFGKIPETIRNLFPQITIGQGVLEASCEGVLLTKGFSGLKVRGHLAAKAQLESTTFESRDQRMRLAGLKVDITSKPGTTEVYDIEASFQIDHFEIATPGMSATIRDATFITKLKDLLLPPTSAGLLAFRADLPETEFKVQGLALKGTELRLILESDLSSIPPRSAKLSLPFRRLIVQQADRPSITFGPGSANLSIEDLYVDLVKPEQSQGHLNIEIREKDSVISLDVTKQGDDLRFDTTVTAKSLAIAARFMPEAISILHIPWPGVSGSVRISGRVTNIGVSDRLWFENRVIAEVQGLALRLSNRVIRLPGLTLNAQANGDMKGASLKAYLAARAPVVEGQKLADELRLDLLAQLKQAKMTAETDLRAIKAGTEMLNASLVLEGDARSLSWNAKLSANDLKPFGSAFLPIRVQDLIEWKRMELSIKGKASDAIGLGRTIKIYPLAKASGSQEVSLHISDLKVRGDEATVELPELVTQLKTELVAGAAFGQLNISLPSLALSFGGEDVRGENLTIRLQGRADALRKDTDAEASLDMTLGNLRLKNQNAYPMSDIVLNVHASCSKMASFKIDRFVFSNAGGGSDFKLSAVMESPGTEPLGRRSLFVQGVLSQSLDKFATSSFSGRGYLKIPFIVESADRSVFHIEALPEMENVSFEIPSKNVSVMGLSGVMRIVEDLSLGQGGVAIVEQQGANPFALVRFHDLHPFITGRSFISLDRLRLGPFEAGPLAGNLRIMGKVISLDQLEAKWRDGHITGQLVVDTSRARPAAYFRGAVTGVRPSDSDERLDANAALNIDLAHMDMEGRVHIIRISRNHLLDLLDSFDPWHEDVTINRIRMGLSLGYPKYARLRMDQGFLSAKVELGGLTSAIRIDEIKGIPTGPLLRKYLGKFHGGLQ